MRYWANREFRPDEASWRRMNSPLAARVRSAFSTPHLDEGLAGRLLARGQGATSLQRLRPGRLARGEGAGQAGCRLALVHFLQGDGAIVPARPPPPPSIPPGLRESPPVASGSPREAHPGRRGPPPARWPDRQQVTGTRMPGGTCSGDISRGALLAVRPSGRRATGPGRSPCLSGKPVCHETAGRGRSSEGVWTRPS
jgi:hypothetical protein